MQASILVLFLVRRSIGIDDEETTGSLTTRLADLGAAALLEALPDWIAGRITPQPQDESKVSHTRMLKKEEVSSSGIALPVFWPGRHAPIRPGLALIPIGEGTAQNPCRAPAQGGSG